MKKVLVIEGKKNCGVCGCNKIPEEFGKKTWMFSGLSGDCKDCHNAASAASAYGISLEAWDEMMLTQGGMCAICDCEAKLCGDHDHATGEFRALLCYKCNSALGFFNDSENLLQKAIAYVSSFK